MWCFMIVLLEETVDQRQEKKRSRYTSHTGAFIHVKWKWVMGHGDGDIKSRCEAFGRKKQATTHVDGSVELQTEEQGGLTLQVKAF